jgi:hypothetical protein
MRKVTQKKTPDWAGATPILTAFSRPKSRGIAPARPEPLGAVFCPRVYGKAIEPECAVHTIRNSEGTES